MVQAVTNVYTLVHSQARGELQRLYSICLLTGMDYHVSAIPPDYVVESGNAEFKPAVMSGLFEEGRRVITSETPWRTTPPGFGSGESVLMREGPSLAFRPRGPLLPIGGPRGTKIPPRHPSSSAVATPTVPLTISGN